MDLQRNKVKKSSFYRRYQEMTNSPTLDERVEGGVKIALFPKIIMVHPWQGLNHFFHRL